MKTCIITGAGSGIGRSVAIEIGSTQDFSRIYLLGRNMEKLSHTKESMRTNAKVSLIIHDLNDLDGIPDLVKGIYEQTGEINCLLNIAGYTDPQALLATTIENMMITYRVNVFAPFVLIRECVKYMRLNSNTSKILNVASTAGITPRPGWLSYSSSKAAIVSMSQTLTEELAEYGIKVYCISPGRCATALRRKLAPDEDQSKIMQPEDVSHVVSQLIADNEWCLDGQNIIIRKKA